MDQLQRRWSLQDLYHRGQVVYDLLDEDILAGVRQSGKLKALKQAYKGIEKDPRLRGILVCSLDNKIISRSPRVPKGAQCDWSEPEKSEASAQASSDNMRVGGYLYHRGIFLVRDESRKEEEKNRAYALVFHDPAYLAQRTGQAKKILLYIFIALGFGFSVVTLIVYRWSYSGPAEQISQVMRGVLTGDKKRIVRALEGTEFAPLLKDVDEVLYEYKQKKHELGKEEEAKYWTANKLAKEVEDFFGDSRVCVVANEEPYIHNRKGTGVSVRAPASGVVAAMEPIVRALSGLWVGEGSGSADQRTADKEGHIMLPPENPEYALRRVFLSRDEEQGFYYGFSNEGLWPLCHVAHERPTFRKEDWDQYVAVNAKYANTVCEEMKVTQPIVLVQDLHFAILPSMLRKLRPDALTSLVWHSPWPSSEKFRICPWRKDILEGMLGADLISFHQQTDVTNFMNAVDRFLEARVLRDQFQITYEGHTTHVRPFPIGVNYPSPKEVEPKEIQHIKKEVFDEYGLTSEMKLGVGVDRLDYTKGIVEKFRAIELFLKRHPEWVGKLNFVQVIAPSKMHIRRYQDLFAEIQKVADEINWKFYADGYQPITLKLQQHSRTEVHRLYVSADFAFVSPLHDGMNLVAKEFVAARTDELGVLILSSFSGAARELKDALIVNPYDTEECSDAIELAIEMDKDEQGQRMSRMRTSVANYNIYAWGHHFFRQLHTIAERKNGE